MRIIEIAALSNGAHRNQTPNRLSVIPDGWAVVPDDLETKNFPFGEVVVETVDGVPTVTAWTPGTAPEPERKPPAQLREEAYNTMPGVEWEGDSLTVTQAAQKWQYYAAEGDMEQAAALTALIAQAKTAIRAQYPDEGAV